MRLKSDGGMAKAKKVIETVIKELGITPADNVIDAVEGGYAWQVARGSADVMISLVPGVNEAAARLRVVSPIVKFDKVIPQELAVYLLELNGTDLPGVSFGLISKDVIVLVAERSVAELDPIEAQEMLSLVGYYADKYDDVLVKEFGGTRVCDLD